MKKVLLLSLILILSFAVFGCSTDVDDGTIQDNNSEVQEVQLVDLEGFDFDYYVAISRTNSDTILGYLPNTEFGDIALQRIAEVENDLNCKIIIKPALFAAVSTTLTKMMAGGDVYDAIQSESYAYDPFIAREAFMPYSEVADIINYTDEEKWGKRNLLEPMVYQNELYGIMPATWPELYYTYFGHPLLVNEDLVKAQGHNDPREFVEQKQWDWNKFSQVLQDYTVINGDDILYAMTVHPQYFVESSLRSNGGSLAVKEDSGYVSGINKKNALDAFIWCSQIYSTDRAECFNRKVTDTVAVANYFIDQKAVMTIQPVERIYGVEGVISFKLDAEIGVLPFPNGPMGTYGKWTGTFESMNFIITIPTLAEDYRASAHILNYLYRPLPGYETKEKQLESYNKNVFFDKRDSDVFFTMLDNAQYTYFIQGVRSFYEGSAALKSATAVTSKIDSASKAYQVILEKNIIPAYESVEYIWGAAE